MPEIPGPDDGQMLEDLDRMRCDTRPNDDTLECTFERGGLDRTVVVTEIEEFDGQIVSDGDTVDVEFQNTDCEIVPAEERDRGRIRSDIEQTWRVNCTVTPSQ